eukprot:Gregarina_sp_Pseudo_9__2079@NODE_2445_length_992_cov_519_565582_g2248_i0_p1_GENE_NODE_2445_length_992_cov_519_565582_g2248_i0NODE_2445_length_992_cov_519_565582_g2248_i0_p1_ORF_typecomplete_len260_score70_90Ribosomal_S4e/PF00900_20/2_1e03Ribosomal_S4e/PF00900_20/4_7e31Ribosomal_S4e/PF00900_20/1_3e0340S_S4_C/PF16121_5/9240S_S4_C/PF16121_5/2_5e16RS4NT/PF08071_12/3_9e16S4/PF01479_25/0_006_NODE_2445_length_992_cov_519_565582_g2248_i0104883
MGAGFKKHLKRIATPGHWCLDKLSGIYAPRPSSGPHKLRDCLPLALLIRNRLKYALTYDEVKLIVMQKLIKIDGKVRTDKTFPCGFMDVVSIEKTQKHFRMLYDVKGRFVPHKVKADEATYKLCRVRKVVIGKKGIPYAYLHDGRTVRYCHPDVKVNDTLKVDLATGKPLEHLKFEVNALAMITAGRSIGRVGKVVSHEKHPGSVDMVQLKDARNETFTTKIENVFIIGSDNKCLVSLPKEKGIKKTILEQQRERISGH